MHNCQLRLEWAPLLLSSGSSCTGSAAQGALKHSGPGPGLVNSFSEYSPSRHNPPGNRHLSIKRSANQTFGTKRSLLRNRQSMAIVSSNHVVVWRLMGCARSSGIDEGLQDNVTAPLVQALLNACDIAYGASCGEQPLHQELRARGQSVVRANLQLRRGTVHCRPGWRTAQTTQSLHCGLGGPPHQWLVLAGCSRSYQES